VLRWGWDAMSRMGWAWLNFLPNSIFKSHPGLRFPTGMRLREDNILMLNAIRYVDCVCIGKFAGYYYRRRNGCAGDRRLDPADFAPYSKHISDLASGVLPLSSPEERLCIVTHITEEILFNLRWVYDNHQCKCEFVGWPLWMSIIKAWRNSVIKIGYLARNERIPLFVTLTTGSLIGFKINYWLLRAYSSIRRWLEK